MSAQANTHTLQHISSNDRSYWLITNLMFESHPELVECVKLWCRQHPAVESLNLVSELGNIKDQLPIGQQILMPYSSEPMSQEDLCDFFSVLLTSKAELLIAYIDVSEVCRNAMHKVHVRRGISTLRRHTIKSGHILYNYLKNKLDFMSQAQSHHVHVPEEENIQNWRSDWKELSLELQHIQSQGGLLTQRGEFELYLTNIRPYPHLTMTLGWLREITYRSAGEGSKQSLDLDEYDQYFDQLFLVDRSNQKIVGGYRIGHGARIISKFGIKGFYTNSLYEINEQAQRMLEQSVELGRSFIIPEYQRRRLPLFMLWNGILSYIRKTSATKYIFGLVSISRAYSDISRSLMVQYLLMHHFDGETAELFRPYQSVVHHDQPQQLAELIQIFEGHLLHLDEFIADIEPSGHRMPVLIRKYLDQNAKFIGFSLDPNFSDCIDGLMMLDLSKLPMKTIQMLGK